MRKDILSKWELKDPPKPRGGARLVNIRTLDSMEEIDKAVGFEGSSDREQRYQEPRAFVGGNVGETSGGGNNTAFTFGVPIASAVDKSTGITGETAQTLPEDKQNGRSETLVSLTIYRKNIIGPDFLPSYNIMAIIYFFSACKHASNASKIIPIILVSCFPNFM